MGRGSGGGAQSSGWSSNQPGGTAGFPRSGPRAIETVGHGPQGPGGGGGQRRGAGQQSPADRKRAAPGESQVLLQGQRDDMPSAARLHIDPQGAPRQPSYSSLLDWSATDVKRRYQQSLGAPQESRQREQADDDRHVGPDDFSSDTVLLMPPACDKKPKK